MAMAETAAARKLLHDGAIVARGVADVGGLSFGPWDLVTGFFANILGYLLAALAGAAHLLVLPLELLWQGLVTAGGAIGSGIDGLWQHVAGFFSGILTALAGVPHLLVLPLEKLRQWLVAAAAGASSGIDGLWQHVAGFFAGIWASIAAAAHQLVQPLETLWQWLATTTADAAGAISSGFDGLWHLAAKFFPEIFAHISAALAVAAHELPHKLDELWRWLKAAAAVALPFVLAAAAVLLLVALVWFFGSILCAAAVGVCKALVYGICYLGHGLYYVAVAVGGAVSYLLPPGAQCLSFCAGVTMKAPGAAGMVISRAAFDAAPALYFQILRTGGSVVAAAIFYTATGASFLAAPVAALFRG
ncbi:unnamed protein product [Urochloa humidicola]